MPTRWEVTKAVRASDLPAPSRLVMLVLADVAKVGTAEIPEQFTPSLAVLAKETGLGKATVARHLASLEGARWVVRERPDGAAMVRGERTRYRLTVPAGISAAQPAVPDGDQAGPGTGQGSSQSGTTLVSERDQPSLRAGQPYKEVRSSSDQTDPFGAPPSASTANGNVDDETAQTILAAYIDYCASKGVNVRSLRGQYAKTIKEALDAGHKPRFVRHVLAKMLADKVANRPSLLRNRLVEAQTGPEGRNSQHRAHQNDPNADYHGDL